jgi:hypothetical protein
VICLSVGYQFLDFPLIGFIENRSLSQVSFSFRCFRRQYMAGKGLAPFDPTRRR